MKAFHSQQACLSLLGVLLGGPGTGESLAVQGTEARLTAQEARHEEVEQGPKLQYAVLDGCASQNEAVLSYQGLACLCQHIQQVKDKW